MRLPEAVAGARILAFGGYQPDNVVTNDDLAAVMDTNDEWIRSRVGIISRRIAGPEETVGDMPVAAAGKAIASSGVSPAEIDLVIVATCSSEAPIPNVSAGVASPLRIIAPGAYDLNAACRRFCYGLANASDAIRSGSARHVLVIGSEKMSAWVDPLDRATAIIFAHGGGAGGGRPAARSGRRSGRRRAGGLGQRRRDRRPDRDQGPHVVPGPGGPGGVPLGHHRAVPDRAGRVRAGRGRAG